MNLLRESFTAVTRRWTRNLLTILALALGTATVVAMLGISASSAAHLASSVIDADDTSMTASFSGPEAWSTDDAALARSVAADPSIQAVGTLNLPDNSQQLKMTHPRDHRTYSAPWGIATAQGLAAREVRWRAGAMPELPAEQAEACRGCVVLGRSVAESLGVSTEPGNNMLSTARGELTVVGILTDNQRSTALSTAVILTPQTAHQLGLRNDRRGLAVKLSPGGAEAARQSLDIALGPDSLDPVTYAVPPSARDLRQRLSAESQRTATTITAVMVISTVFSTVTTMLMAVAERRREIGIDRAMGRTRWGVSVGFLLESMLVGGIGTVLGYAAGVLTAGAVSALNEWPFLLPAQVLLLPMLGAAVGALAGMLPAYLASRVRPAELLRG